MASSSDTGPHTWKILKIMPATGWCSEHKDGDGAIYREPLIAWALTEIPADIHGTPTLVVTGVMSSCEDIQSTMFSEEDSGFQRYLYLPDCTHTDFASELHSFISTDGKTVTVYLNGVPEERAYDLENASAPGRIGPPKAGRESMIPRLRPGEKRAYTNGRWEIRSAGGK